MSAIEALRTPDARFETLPGWSFAPRYVDDLPGHEGLRMHYVDEGPAQDAPVFLCLHGEPSWGYLYRKMAPVFLAAGARVIAPDFFGFGRSDKPVEDAVYTINFHRDAILAFIDRLALKDICLVCQDWGGLIGLTLPMDRAEAFTRLIVMNTGIGIGRSPGPGFDAWKAYAAANPDLDVGGLMQRSIPGLSDAERAAYDAPFPDVRYKAGVRRFPELVPVSPEMDGVELGKRALAFWSTQWTGESFMGIGMQDPVLGAPVMHALRSAIRGCPEPLEVAEGGHFVQEHGEGIARAALAHFGLGQG